MTFITRVTFCVPHWDDFTNLISVTLSLRDCLPDIRSVYLNERDFVIRLFYKDSYSS